MLDALLYDNGELPARITGCSKSYYYVE